MSEIEHLIIQDGDEAIRVFGYGYHMEGHDTKASTNNPNPEHKRSCYILPVYGATMVFLG
jgi:hypothetical protein